MPIFDMLMLLAAVVAVAQGVDNGLGRTPQMGWNSWNKFGCNINETLIKNTADLLVQTGLADKGYRYLNLDDCWQVARDPKTSRILSDPVKCPSGMSGLADYAHAKGLKFGLYSDAGEKTCEGRPGGYGYEKIDAETYAEWKVDYLKYDNCYNLNLSGKARYFAMHKALNESGRPIFYSMCNWGEEKSWQWAGPYANSWRTTGDIKDNWKSFTSILDKQVGLEFYAGHGGWNDPDMLEVGNGGMTFDEYTAHFALWCALKAPLLIGCSLSDISKETLSILGNEELIAINQDPLGIQASRIKRSVLLEGTT